ncbi:hypothetical protein AAVH_10241 [Aphelenchoides avenae]|nr:hypothetical protein AAVH_10241 [Aphelenchus avenae]
MRDESANASEAITSGDATTDASQPTTSSESSAMHSTSGSSSPPTVGGCHATTRRKSPPAALQIQSTHRGGNSIAKVTLLRKALANRIAPCLNVHSPSASPLTIANSFTLPPGEEDDTSDEANEELHEEKPSTLKAATPAEFPEVVESPARRMSSPPDAAIGGGDPMSTSMLRNPAWYRDPQGRTGFQPPDWRPGSNLQRSEIKPLRQQAQQRRQPTTEASTSQGDRSARTAIPIPSALHRSTSADARTMPQVATIKRTGTLLPPPQLNGSNILQQLPAYRLNGASKGDHRPARTAMNGSHIPWPTGLENVPRMLHKSESDAGANRLHRRYDPLKDSPDDDRTTSSLMDLIHANGDDRSPSQLSRVSSQSTHKSVTFSDHVEVNEIDANETLSDNGDTESVVDGESLLDTQLAVLRELEMRLERPLVERIPLKNGTHHPRIHVESPSDIAEEDASSFVGLTWPRISPSSSPNQQGYSTLSNRTNGSSPISSSSPTRPVVDLDTILDDSRRPSNVSEAEWRMIQSIYLPESKNLMRRSPNSSPGQDVEHGQAYENGTKDSSLNGILPQSVQRAAVVAEVKKTIAGDLRPQRNEFLNGLARNGTTTNGGPAVSSLDRQGRIANGESNGTHDAMKTMPRTAKFNGSMLPRPVKEAQRVTGRPPVPPPQAPSVKQPPKSLPVGPDLQQVSFYDNLGSPTAVQLSEDEGFARLNSSEEHSDESSKPLRIGAMNGDRKTSYDSALSTDSRESVVSAASLRAETKGRRRFNY